VRLGGSMVKWPKRLSVEERIAERERIRTRGKGFFILIRGVLVFGFFAFVIDLAVNYFFEHRHLDLAFLIAKIVQWALAGLIYGWMNWRFEFDDEENEG
jgi:uncharacterized membrane protein YdbT with pleckstrin-like domain